MSFNQTPAITDDRDFKAGSELEAKIRIEPMNLITLRARLSERGSALFEGCTETDTIYSRSSEIDLRRFYGLKHRTSSEAIREEFIFYRKSIFGSEEYARDLSWARIPKYPKQELKALQLRPVLKYRKRRSCWKMDEITFCLDEFGDQISFLEMSCRPGLIEEARCRARDDLGMAQEVTTYASYTQLSLEQRIPVLFY